MVLLVVCFVLLFVVCVVRWCVALGFFVVRCCCLLFVMHYCLVFVSLCSVLLRCRSMVRVDVVRRCLLFAVGVLRVNCCYCGVLLFVDHVRFGRRCSCSLFVVRGLL